MWSHVAITRAIKSRLLRLPRRPIEHAATREWVVAPAETAVTLPAIFLPGQIERISGWMFCDDHPGAAMVGGQTVEHSATRAFLIKGATLIDGVLSKGRYHHFLKPRTRFLPSVRVEQEIDRGSLYGTWGGIRWFGQWLIDDCVLHPLAATEGLTISSGPAATPHVKTYRDWLGIRQQLVTSAYFHEIVVFNDYGQNAHRRERMRMWSERLLSHVGWEPHPGVFILRGMAGDRRMLRNELELADRLRTHRGFQVLDPLKADVASIVRACAGAKVIIGVEGSALAHGAYHLRPGCAMLTLQPPKRFVQFYKPHVESMGARFAFVVGLPEGEDFRVDPEEVERTLDLLEPVTEKVEDETPSLSVF